MKKLKVIWGNWVKKIKKLGIVKMINYKDDIKKLTDEKQKLEQEIRDLKDLYNANKINKKQLDNAKIKIASLEDIVKASDKAIKGHIKRIKELDKANDTLLDKSFKLELEIKSKEIQLEEYKLEIKDLKSDRYLIRKIPAGRTKNTIKTKVSKPMSGNVTRYMRGEHE